MVGEWVCMVSVVGEWVCMVSESHLGENGHCSDWAGFYRAVTVSVSSKFIITLLMENRINWVGMTGTNRREIHFSPLSVPYFPIY